MLQTLKQTLTAQFCWCQQKRPSVFQTYQKTSYNCAVSLMRTAATLCFRHWKSLRKIQIAEFRRGLIKTKTEQRTFRPKRRRRKRRAHYNSITDIKFSVNENGKASFIMLIIWFNDERNEKPKRGIGGGRRRRQKKKEMSFSFDLMTLEQKTSGTSSYIHAKTTSKQAYR